jgi:hypothetical protein
MVVGSSRLAALPASAEGRLMRPPPTAARGNGLQRRSGFAPGHDSVERGPFYHLQNRCQRHFC